MGNTLYLHTPLTPDDLDLLLDGHRKAFEEALLDAFTDEELERHERLLEGLASVEAQPLLEGLGFDDMVVNPAKEDEQRAVFAACRSTLCLENVPWLETNPFQVSYLKDLLSRLPATTLVDRGGMEELVFGRDYLRELAPLKDMVGLEAVVPEAVARRAPVLGPIEILVHDVSRELERLEGITIPIQERSEKLQKIFRAFASGERDPGMLLRLSGLNAKDFGDGLEGLKFFLKKL